MTANVMTSLPPAVPSRDDRTLVDHLYREHQGWLRGWLRKRLGCPQHAADITHDTFLRILTAPERLELQQPRSFLGTIARRLLVDRARREVLERAYLEALQCQVEIGEIMPSAEAVASALQLLEQLAKVLQGLAPRVRTAFLLRQLDGLTHDEIAHRLGVSTRMVRKYLVQALLHCHRQLNEIT